MAQKRYQIELYIQWRTNKSHIWSIERRQFQWPSTTPTPSFKVTPFFDAEYLRNGTRYKHSFNEILIGTYTCPTQQCYFEWPWVTLGDLAKYSMTRSVARSLRQLSLFTKIWRYIDFQNGGRPPSWNCFTIIRDHPRSLCCWPQLLSNSCQSDTQIWRYR